MNNTLAKKISGATVFTVLITIIVLSILSYGGYLFLELQKKSVSQEKAIDDLVTNLEDEQNRNTGLNKDLQVAKDQLNSLTGQIGGISSTVGTLKKLSETDPELLKKYSKVYFLNENFAPKSLIDISPEYLYLKTKPLKITSEIWPHFQALLKDATEKGLGLQVISAYRSFDTQTGLKSSYTVTYGSGANKFSADQGYSEHQLGTAIDFTTPKAADTFSGFSKTAEYKWLTENAWKYGFIISYPDNNAYYQFEPWHWRYVGVVLATKLHNEKKFFYDLDQREIDAFLVNFFD